MKGYLKAIILTATIYPFLWLILYYFGFFGEINWPVHLSILLVVALSMTIFYISKIVSNPELKKDTKFIWILGMLIFGSLTQVAYFAEYVYPIRRG